MNRNTILLAIVLVFSILIVGIFAIGYSNFNDANNVEVSEDMENTINGIITFESFEGSFVNTTVYIKLEDVSLMDAPSKIIAQTTLEDVSMGETTDNSIPFKIGHGELQEGYTYSLSAHVDVDGDGSVSAGDYLTTQHVGVPVTGIEGIIEVPVEFIEGYSDNGEESESLSSFNGTISSIEDTDSYPMILLESMEITEAGHDRGVKFVISEDTVIQDPAGGLYNVENLEEGMKVRVFFEPVMTTSIPPIGQAKLIQLI